MHFNNEWLKQLNYFLLQPDPLIIVTITDVKGSAPRAIGAKMFINHQGRLWGTIGGGKLEELAIFDAKNILYDNLAVKIQYPLSAKVGQCCGGSVDVLFEPMNSSPQLYIFGSGHVGRALANIMVGTVFNIHVVDERSEWCLSSEIHHTVQRHNLSPIEFIRTVKWFKTKIWAVIMTHDHALDQSLVGGLSQAELNYVGLIGSQTKWRRFRARLATEGLSQELIDKIHCPVGLAIGAESPQEIAISISAELIKIYYEEQKKILLKQPKQGSVWSAVNDDPCEVNF
jgi:xanthine dehydrogenase accessory factor